MSRRKVESANPHPCAACPWRTVNHGKPHPHGWYTVANRRRLWSKLRRGDSMTCHPTDPENEVPDGTKRVSKSATTHECAGALVLQQREIEKVQGFRKFSEYVRTSRVGLTMRGLATLVNRAVFGALPFMGAIEMTKTDLNEPVSHPPLGEWDPRAVKAARKALKE